MMRVAIALGDPNGIGPEIAVEAATHFARDDRIDPLLVGDGFVIEETARRLGLATPAFVEAPALEFAAYAPGTLDPRAGWATVAYAAAAVRLALAGEVDAVIGCPHSETAVNRAGIAFSGYPGLVADLTGTPRERAFLMLAAQGLRIAHATLHEPVGAALARLTPDLVIALAQAAVATARRLGIAAPRLGLFGINPHAGEDGLFGDEDERVTKPAAAALRAGGIAIDGPLGADLLLGRRGHDIYLAMFHDQGHIPIKLLSPLRASALAIGTPVLFASVAHGCAFDIAGQGVADPTGVIETVTMLAGIRSS
ncbi:4-hydroxythreonine-4-phosphate dehydrogenase PdxA [Enhydrobacter sp.]|jgi:4-hydroxy-L-threonine phosphate dehydrogenase PdxA|uniref:PdxA family dehydrogenase n=1 Tax=Enhydrobacter sp. TaxID=1894999 RepID=UPI0026289A3C|nr:4-hydroxythreonine-4-phosphate dehydrogenase PdxA [Enhydrobacter sp.]WIM14468.1 MAG: 4-hydroxythreonine-4-phosphate dehydrogenase [Enhydrobacter sp.]